MTIVVTKREAAAALSAIGGDLVVDEYDPAIMAMEAVIAKEEGRRVAFLDL